MPTPWSPDGYRSAYRFAAEAHHGQTVPGTTIPYLVHLGLVAMEVMTALTVEPGYDGDLAVQCALLHDVLEDTPIAYAQLEARFGPLVAQGVAALTKNASLPKSGQMGESLARIRQQPTEVWMVKLADRITNLQPPPAGWSSAKRQRYRDEACEIYHALGSASPYLAARLRLHIEQYGAYIS